jgi:hypothetical protein
VRKIADEDNTPWLALAHHGQNLVLLLDIKRRGLLFPHEPLHILTAGDDLVARDHLGGGTAPFMILISIAG